MTNKQISEVISAQIKELRKIPCTFGMCDGPHENKAIICNKCFIVLNLTKLAKDLKKKASKNSAVLNEWGIK